jgi:hypothetical protein
MATYRDGYAEIVVIVFQKGPGFKSRRIRQVWKVLNALKGFRKLRLTD